MVVREDRGAIAVLRMAHGRANALDPEILGALSAALEAATDASAVVLTGSGPMNSWPSTTPLGSPGTRPWYWCRSDPQTALVVMRTTTSVGSTIFGSATDSTRTSPVPCSVIAFIAVLPSVLRGSRNGPGVSPPGR